MTRYCSYFVFRLERYVFLSQVLNRLSYDKINATRLGVRKLAPVLLRTGGGTQINEMFSQLTLALEWPVRGENFCSD